MNPKLQTLFDKNHIKQTLLNTAYVLFLLSLLYRFVEQLFATYSYDSWNISEYLINYQGGFVRRGLTGEILFFFAQNFNINIEWTVKIFCLICFGAVCVFFVRAFLKKGYSLYILPLCFFLGMGILWDGGWIRKDYFFIAFLIPVLWIYKSNLHTIIKFLIINALIVFVILSHEVFAFFTLPVLFLMFFGQYESKGIFKSTVLSILFLLPSFVAFILTLYYHGNTETVQAIWNSWGIETVESGYWNAVGGIGWKTEWAFSLHFKGNFLEVNKGIFSSLVWCITFPVVYYIATNALLVFRKDKNSFTSKHKTVLSAILIIQLFYLLPVFALLCTDYSRVFFFWIASSYAIFLIIPANLIKNIIPAFFAKFIISLNNFLSNILFPRKTTLVLLMLFVGISPYTFVLDTVINNSMIYNILYILSKPFIILREFLIST